MTFILAVLLTALAFICCRRYWKERDRNVEIHETHFYRMACSSSNAPLVSPAGVQPFSASFRHSNATASFSSPLTSPPALLDVFQPYSLTLPHRRSTNHELGGPIAMIEPPGYPPPPYQSHPSLETTDVSSANNANSSSVSIVPARNKPIKPFWRKLSQ